MTPVQRFSAIDGGMAANGRSLPRLPAAGANTGTAHPTVEISAPGMPTRRTMTMSGITSESVEHQGPRTVRYRFQAPVHLLIAYEEGERRGGATSIEGAPQSELRSFARKLTFVPAGREYREQHAPGENVRLTFLYIDPARLALASQPGFAANLIPRLFFDDPAVWQTVAKLKISQQAASAPERLYLEALVLVLMHDLARIDCAATPARPKSRGGLAGWQQRTAAAYIEKHAAERIPLAKLARLVDLSPHHFCRAFKQSFGKPPHRYQIEHRVERAKALLAEPFGSVTQVALELGFSSASSFATAFRKVTGLTATGYARSLAVG